MFLDSSTQDQTCSSAVCLYHLLVFKLLAQFVALSLDPDLKGLGWPALAIYNIRYEKP